MKRRWFFSVGLILLGTVAALKLSLSESVYEGRTTTQWLTTLEGASEIDREEAVTALKCIGGEAVKETCDLLTHPVAEVRLAAFDVLEGVLHNCNQNFEEMNCVTGFVPGRGRGRSVRAIPPIAEAMMGCLFGQDKTLRRRAEATILNVPWYYALTRRATADRLLELLYAGLEADSSEMRDQAGATFSVILEVVAAWQPDLLQLTASRLLDIAVRQDSPSKALMRTLLLCLVLSPQEAGFADRVHMIEGQVIGMLESESASQRNYGRYDAASIRYWAAAVLQRYGTMAAVPALRNVLEDDDDNVSGTSRAALRRIGDPPAIPVPRAAAEPVP